MYTYDQSKAAPCRNLDGVNVKAPSMLTAQFLMQNKLPIWVITAIPPQSLLTFTIKQGGGLPGRPLRLDRSKLPQCVTTDHPHDALAKGGQDVWNAIEKGVLVLVWPSDAEALLGDRKQDENRTQLSKWSTLNAEKSPEVKSHEKTLRQHKQATENAETDEAAEQQEPVNARVLDIVARTKAGEVKLDKAIAEFDNMSEAMTERDYQYAVTNVKGGKLREWLQTAMAKGVFAEPAKPKKNKKAQVRAGSDAGVLDDSEPEMTEEEKEAEAEAEAMARQRQRIGG